MATSPYVFTIVWDESKNRLAVENGPFKVKVGDTVIVCSEISNRRCGNISVTFPTRIFGADYGKKYPISDYHKKSLKVKTAGKVSCFIHPSGNDCGEPVSGTIIVTDNN